MWLCLQIVSVPTSCYISQTSLPVLLVASYRIVVLILTSVNKLNVLQPILCLYVAKLLFHLIHVVMILIINQETLVVLITQPILIVLNVLLWLLSWLLLLVWTELKTWLIVVLRTHIWIKLHVLVQQLIVPLLVNRMLLIQVVTFVVLSILIIQLPIKLIS